MKFLLQLIAILIFLVGIYCVEWGLNIKDLFRVSNIAIHKGYPLEIPKEYTKIEVEGINGTIYSDTFSKLDNITALVVRSSYITGLEDGAVCTSPNLKKLEIDFQYHYNTIPFTKNILKNCENLEELALIFNFDVTTKIDDDTFENLSKLKKLTVRNHRIRHLKKDFLNNLKSLTNLTLFGSYMEEIDGDVFEHMTELQEIDLNIHALRRLPKKLFKNTKKLRRIDLSHGNLTDLSWDEFEGLSSLKTLSLFENKIRNFDADKVVKNMPSLEELSIELNHAECKKIELFAKEVSEKINHSIVIYHQYVFDPEYHTCAKENQLQP